MHAGEEHEAAEPSRYFRDGQWFSVKQGDWVDPSSEIKMDFLKKANKAMEEVEAVSDTLEKAGDVVETSAEILDEAGQLAENGGDLQEVVEQTVEVVEETQEIVEETKEILDETEEFIEKFEAVEKYRKESEEHNGVTAAAAGVDIVIHAAEEIAEEDQGVVEEVAAVVQEKVEEVTEESAKEEEAYEYRANEEETCEEVAAEDEGDAEAYYRENGLLKESEDVKEVEEDTKSIVSVFATVGDESKTVFKGGEALTNGHTGSEVENFDIDGDGQVVVGGVIVADDADKVSLSGSIRSVKSRTGSIKSTKSTTGSVRSVKSTRNSVRSVQSVKERGSILEESIFKTQDVEVENDNVSVKSRTGSVRSVKSNRSSVRSVQSVKERQSILEDSIFNKEEAEVEDDNISVKTLTEEDENKDADSYSYKAREDTESLMGDDEKEPEVFYRENGYDKGDGDNVSVISYDVNTDYIPSLHQRVGSVKKVAEKVETQKTAPEPAPRSAPAPAPATQSYEEERSQIDFDDVVRKNQEKYRGETKLSNEQILDNIAREEGEDRPNISQLLAWAKGTRKAKTETFVVRSKKREDVLKRAVDIGGVEMVIEEKAKKEEEKVDVVKEKPADPQAEAAVTSEWLEVALKEASQTEVVNIVKIEFEKLAQGVHKVQVVAKLGGGFKDQEFHWVIRPAEKLEGRSLLVADLMSKLGRLSGKVVVPFQRVQYSDAKHAALDDISNYSPCVDNVLDEAHLKVAVRAMAKLHALSLVYLTNDVGSAKSLAEPGYTRDQQGNTKVALEASWSGLVEKLGEGERAKAGKLLPMLFNLYRQARQAETALSVLCHGSPSPQNVVFLYKDGVPVEAKFLDFSRARIASAATDLLAFIHSAGDSTAREDFLIRFVYYETLVTSMKSLGVREPVISYDDLKAECVRKRQYGYVESAALLAASVNGAPPPIGIIENQPKKVASGRAVNSKILGTFVPNTKAKVAAVTAFSSKDDRAFDRATVDRVADLVSRAVNVK